MNEQRSFFEKIHLLTAVFSLWLLKTRVLLVLAGWVIPDWVASKTAWVRSGPPVSRVVGAVILVLAVTVPSKLYLDERDERIRLKQAYRYLNASSSSEITTLKGTLGTLLEEQSELRSLLLETGRPVISDGVLAIQLTATGYSSCVFETDDTPFITASNTRTRPGIIALSRDLLRRYNAGAPFSFGDTVHVTGLGEFIVEDSMHWRWRRRMDVWFPSRTHARQFGVRKVVVSKPVGKEDSGSDDTAANFNSGSGVAVNTALAR